MTDHSTLVWAAIGSFIFIGYTLEAITGFGSIVIALSLGALLVPIAQLLPVLVPLSVALSSTMVWRYRQLVDRPMLVRMILPLMVTGTVVGYGIRPFLDAALMRQLFGIFVLWFALRELWRMRVAGVSTALPAWMARGVTFVAGVTQGLFASGGPLLVYALAGSPLDKSRFRATLAAVWMCLNVVLTTAFFLDGSLVPALPQVASYLPVLFIGVWIGEKLHKRVSEQHFRLAIYGLLLVTGSLLLIPRPQ